MENNVLSVRMWDMEVGLLYWNTDKRVAMFTYNADFLKRQIDIAPIAASVFGPAAQRGLPFEGNREKIYAGLPSFIADSLPDDWGNQLFARWAIEQHIPQRKLTSVDRLAFIGKRGMGALEFHPAYTEADAPFAVQIDSLYRLAEQIFSERKQVHFSSDEALQLQNLYRIGTSAGGRRPKAVIAIDQESGDVRSGQVLLPPSYVHYIVKFDQKTDFPFTSVEYAYYLMARDAGIDMMPSRLIEADGCRHFLTQRFDRKDGRKIHTQTLAAMDPLADTYEDLFAVCRRLRIPTAEIAEQYRRMVFNVLAGNVDDHNKNFSFMMDTDGVWHITPAYDMIFAISYKAPAYVNRHEMTIGGKDRDISITDLVQFAKQNGIKGAAEIISQVQEAVAHFPRHAEDACVPHAWAERIARLLQ